MKPKRFTRRSIQDARASISFLVPSLAGVLLLFVVPFVAVIYYAVIDNPIGANFVGMDNFIRVWNNLAFRDATRHTIEFTLVSVPLVVVISLLLAVGLEKRIPGQSLLRTFFLSPLVVPVASIVLIWQVLFHQNGALNEMIASFGQFTGWFTYERAGGGWTDWFRSEHNQLPIIILFVWRNAGYSMILFMAALASVPRELIEGAQIDGASAPYIFFSIKMRFLSPTVVFVVILSIINSFKIFREIYMLTGAYPVGSLYMLQHYMNNMFNNLDYQSLSAAAVIMFVAISLIILGIFFVEGRYGKDIEG